MAVSITSSYVKVMSDSDDESTTSSIEIIDDESLKFDSEAKSKEKPSQETQLVETRPNDHPEIEENKSELPDLKDACESHSADKGLGKFF